MLKQVERQSLGDSVFVQLRDEILRGEIEPGSPLPAERVLCETFGVNRGAVREALKRLQQIRLITMQQGGATRVLDFRAGAGLEVLPALVVDDDGRVDVDVLQSIMEMRSALGADAARLAAQRGGERAADVLDDIVARMRTASGDLVELQALAMEYWEHLVAGSGNIAYRLAFNTMRETYDRFRELLRPLLAEEISYLAGYLELARAVRSGNVEAAESALHDIVDRGARVMAVALERLRMEDDA